MTNISAALKPFVINQSDIQFILDQLNFLPLFDTLGNAVINWDGTGTVYNKNHVAYADQGNAAANIAAYGMSYQSTTDLAGLRDVTGLNNNLSLVNSAYGAVDQIFTRSATADYAHYSPIMQAVADYAYAAAKQYYGKYSDGSATDGTPLGTFNSSGTINTDYTITAVADGTHTASNGSGITIKNVVDYTPRMISLTTTTAGVVYDTWANHAGDPGAANHTANEIFYTNGVATVLDWGQLATDGENPGVGLGQVDTQARLTASAGQDDHYIGGLNPGVSPSNGFFVLFGQFFDHGLDFIEKGGQGTTIKIALATDDPLYGMLGPDGRPVHEITINRATVDHIDANGPEYINHTSPFIDQSQTYGSHEQLTTLLREWVIDPATGHYHAGMSLFDGQTLATAWTKADGTTGHDTLPTLAELRAHVSATARDALTWEDVSNLRNRDADGHIVSGASGSALILDMNPRFDAGHLLGFYDKDGNGVQSAGENSYTNAAQNTSVADSITTIEAQVKAMFGTNSTFGIDPTTHKLTLFMETLPPGSPPGTPHTLDGASALYPFVNFGDFSIKSNYYTSGPALSPAIHAAVGDILLASVGDHYIAGDGRVNENFGLTSIHHIFHEEHNYQVRNLMDALHQQDLATNDVNHDKLHEFQVDVGSGMNAAGDYVDGNGDISWNLDKVFNGAKLIVEMEYQHAAVDQYARNVTPNIQEFVGYSPDKNPAISLEYAQAAFRFGHSTLRETIDTIDPTHGLTGKIMGYALKEAFLSPEKYQAIGPAAILLGMSHQQMNEVDEFVTPALNQGLLGQPLDLAAINIARGRDLGIPTLNDFREAIGLARYTSWTDFGQNMQHPTSLVNFIAAYTFDGSLAKAQAVLDLIDGVGVVADNALILGWNAATAVVDAFAFLEGGDQGFNHIDTWLGGIAEIHQPGGLLGETFDKVFVNQIESLMDGDRFYYLFRLAGQQFAEEVGNGQLKDIVERNSGLTHMNGNIFGYADKYYDFAAQKEVATTDIDPNTGLPYEIQTTSNNHKYGDVYDAAGNFVSEGALTTNSTLGIYSNGGRSSAIDGTVVHINGADYIRDTRLEDFGADTGAANLNGGVNLDGTPNSGAESNEVIVATDRNDLIYAQGGDDTVYGEGGDDIISGGFGIDRLYGGSGSDHINGGDNPDLIDGGSGDDFLYGESSGSDINGADQIIGGSGNDFISGGIGIDKLSGGTGDDHIVGDQDTDPFTHGSDGNDIVEGNSGGDILYGDNGDDVVIGGADQDQLFGNSGDDILRPGDPTGALTIGTDEVLGNDGIDVNDTGFDIIDFSDNTVRPTGVTFDLGNQTNPAVTVNGTPGQVQSFQMDGVIGSAAADTLTGDDTSSAGAGAAEAIAGNNWLIGGSGADTLIGGGGNDIIIGGHVRLDQLVGKYVDANGVLSTYDHNNNNTGLTTADQLLDARYQGASHRVDYLDQLATSGVNAGFIDAANALGGAQFDKHLTEMLRSDQLKNTVLGDALGTDGGDTAVFSGDFADYNVEVVTAANGLIGLKIEGISGQGAADGTDLVYGVDSLQFRDGVKFSSAIINAGPSIISDGGGDTAALARAENGTAVTTVQAVDYTPGLLAYSLAGGADAALFSINATTGVLSFVGAPNYEAPADAGANNVYDVVVQVAETTGLLRTDTQAIAVTVTNINETPAINSLGVASIFENSTAVMNVTAIDPDFGAVVSYTIVGGADALRFALNPTTGALSFVSVPNFEAPTDAGGNNVYDVIVRATDQGGLYSEQPIAVTVNNLAEPPVITSAATTSFNENGVGTVLTVTAMDQDAGQTATLVYSIDPTLDGSNFTINASTGAITFNTAPNFEAPTDSNGDNIYDIAVRATDTDGLSTTQNVHVTVNNVDEAGTGSVNVSSANYTLTGNNQVTVNGISTLADPDLPLGVTPTWSWTRLTGDATPVSGTSAALTITGGASQVSTFQLTGSYTDPFGMHSYTAPETVVVGNNQDENGAGPGGDYAIRGTAGNDIIFGLGGNDTMRGGAGNDVYIVNSGADVVDERVINVVAGVQSAVVGSDAGGMDTVNASVTYTLGNLGLIENLTLTGAGNINGTGNALANTITGNSGNNNLNGAGNNDTINAGGGDDNITYAVSGTINLSGLDHIDGGANGTAAGDRFILNGLAGTAELFRVLSNTDGTGVGGHTGSSAALAGFISSSEIVVSRNGVEIADLDNIEEITINGSAITVPSIPASVAGDTIQVVGNFLGTHLNFNTITIDGGAGNDTVDITGLTSEHRIVFNSGAGNDSVVGTLRAQDVVNMGVTVTVDLATSSGDGDTTPPPAPVTVTDQNLIGDDNANLQTTDGGNDVALGNGGNDLISTGDGADFVNGGAGGDTIVAGAGNDTVYAEDGSDTVFGGEGNDLINAGTGDDNAFGGEGNDTFVARANDGSDSYYGDAGSDTVDMSAVIANIEVNLGTGYAGWAKVGTVSDQLYSIENIVTGSGNDTITASGDHNIIDTGAGHDKVVFHSASDANGDTLLNFEAGDKIDVTGFMNTTGQVNLVNGSSAAAGQIAISFENIGGENFTVLHGHDVNDNTFELNIKGHHALTGTDFAA
jgi:Ca2+-binding RTX toxin-like protein